MFCWGSWSNSLVSTKNIMRFELYYANFSFAMFLAAIFFGLTLGMMNSGDETDANFLQDFDGHVDAGRFIEALAAGLVWNVGNLFLCKGIGMLGLALAFPLCIGTSLVFGTLLTYVIQPSGNAWFLFSGVFIAFVAVCLAAFVNKLKETQQQATAAGPEVDQVKDSENAQGNQSATDEHATRPELNMARKLSVCIAGGILLSLFNPLVTLAEKDGGLSPYGEFTLFTLAALISSLGPVPLILMFPIEGGKGVSLKAAFEEYRQVPTYAHFMAIAGSVVWSLGTLANAVAGNSGVLSSAESFSIGQCANMIAIFWGAFYFKEFRGTNATVKSLSHYTLLR